MVWAATGICPLAAIKSGPWLSRSVSGYPRRYGLERSWPNVEYARLVERRVRVTAAARRFNVVRRFTATSSGGCPIAGLDALTRSSAFAVTRPARIRTLIQPLVASAGCCSTSSPSIMIWISSLTTNLPSSIMLKLRPNCLRLIWLLAL